MADTAPAAEHEAKLRGGIAALKAMERHLARAFLVDERYTIADLAPYAYTHAAPEGGFELEPYPAMWAWLDPASSRKLPSRLRLCR